MAPTYSTGSTTASTPWELTAGSTPRLSRPRMVSAGLGGFPAMPTQGTRRAPRGGSEMVKDDPIHDTKSKRYKAMKARHAKERKRREKVKAKKTKPKAKTKNKVKKNKRK